MIAYIVRFLKRFSVLIPGLIMSYFAIDYFYPAADRRVSVTSAIIATYALTAYVLIPSFYRLIRLIVKPKHLPLYCTTPDGFANDPLNIGVVATRDGLCEAMKKTGWHLADDRNPKTGFKIVYSLLTRRPYPNAPMSALYLFGRSQDLGFELPVDNHPLHRHHVRFWAASYTDSPEHIEHIGFWRKHQKSGPIGSVLWVGAVSLDTGLSPIRHNAQITHLIHPDTNAEREYLVSELKKTRLVKEVRKVKIAKPYQLRNRALNGYMLTDGKISICELKPVKT